MSDAQRVVHVLLDTCILDRTGWLQGFELLALSGAAAKGRLLLHVPWIVEAEYRAHLREEATNSLASVVSRLAQTAELPFLLKETGPAIREIIRRLEPVQNSARSESEHFLEAWLERVKARRHPPAERDIVVAMDRYFSGQLPFKLPRQKSQRAHIPDALIREVAIRVQAEVGELHVVTADNNLHDSLLGTAGVILHRELKGLLSHPSIEAVMAKLPGEILSEWIDTRQAELEATVAHRLTETSLGVVTLDRDGPAIGGDGTATNTRDVRVSLLTDTLRDFGEGIIGIEFTATAVADIFFEIWPHTWEAMPLSSKPIVLGERADSMSVRQEGVVSIRGEAGTQIQPIELLQEGRTNELREFLAKARLGVRLFTQPSARLGTLIHQ